LTAYPRQDDSDFEYSLTWSRVSKAEPEEIIGDVNGVVVYGEMDMTEGGEEPVYDLYDLDEEHWGCDLWDEVVDVNVPSTEKLTSDTLVDLYVKTTNIGEDAASQMFEALRDEIA